MKRLFIIGLLFLIVESMFGQLGYKVGTQFVELFPDSSVVYIDAKALEGRNLQNPSWSTQLSNGKVTKIAQDGFLVSGNNKGRFAEGYTSCQYRDTEGNKMFVLPTLLLALENRVPIDKVLYGFDNILEIQENDDIYKITCAAQSSEDILKQVDAISQIDGVRWCEPNMFAEVIFDNNNPLYSQQYYLHNTGQSGGTLGYDINIEPAWELTKGNSDVVVAIVDKGVELSHEDLSGNVLSGYTVGYPSEIGEPINANTLDSKNHGTMCAGIVNAKDNTVGIVGVAPNVKVLPVNIAPYYATLDNNNNTIEGFASYSDIGTAITWAYQRADIISCSWHSGQSNYIQNAMSNAMTYGRNNKGCIIVAAAGNNYLNNSTTVNFPARMSNVIAVGSIDRYGEISSSSQRGEGLDLVAPGVEIISTDRTGNGPINGKYKIWGGTSFSCPQVAGIAALILSIKSNLTQTKVRQIILDSARDMDDTFTYGHGLADAYAALLTALNDSISGPSIVSEAENFTIGELPDDFDITWSINNNSFMITPSANECLVTLFPDSISAEATLTAAISKNGQTLKTFVKQIYHIGTISRGSVNANQTSFALTNLPSVFSVAWSVNNSAFTLSPSGNQCTVYNQNTYQEGSLTAIVSKDGQTVKTLTMPLLSQSLSLYVSGTQQDYTSLSATYPGHSFYVDVSDAVNGYSSDNIEVNEDCNVTLLSDRFRGMNLGFIGNYELNPLHHNGNWVTFHIPTELENFDIDLPENNGDIMNLNTETIENTGYILTLRAQCDGGYYDFDLNFHVTPIHGLSSNNNDSSLLIDLTGSTLYVSLTDSQVPLGGGLYQQLPWHLNIVNASTGVSYYSQNVTGMNTYVNVGSFPNGLYIVRATLNGTLYTAKFFN